MVNYLTKAMLSVEHHFHEHEIYVRADLHECSMIAWRGMISILLCVASKRHLSAFSLDLPTFRVLTHFCTPVPLIYIHYGPISTIVSIRKNDKFLYFGGVQYESTYGKLKLYKHFL